MNKKETKDLLSTFYNEALSLKTRMDKLTQNIWNALEKLEEK